ncbi:MAG: hypothetical protein ABSC94_12965 [Polyangiaceae bacterium]
MYSAFIPGSTAQTFQIPAVTDDGNQATWSVSDPTQAVLFGQSFNGLPGVMITVQGVGTGSDGGEGSQGTLTVYAVESDGSCGSSVLTITANTEADWQTGNSRYNDGVDLTAAGAGGITRLPDGGFTLPAAAASDAGSVYERDGGTACTNCHGVTATTGPYRDVSHTPEQTGGFSDQQLIGIITQGIIPDGGYFDPSVIVPACDGGGANGGPLEPINEDPVLRGTSADDGGSELCATFAFDTWHSFHQWSDISPDEQPGIICYLRALTPLAQNGTPGANFGRGGGMGRGDGGMRFPRDGGMPPPPDAAGEADSASAVDATTTDASESE